MHYYYSDNLICSSIVSVASPLCGDILAGQSHAATFPKSIVEN
jgi:hypothetical protein